jgi:hypothetical protein
MIRICSIALVLTWAAHSPAPLDAVERCDPAAFAALNSSPVTIRSAERADQGRCRVQASVSAAPGSLIRSEVAAESFACR